MIYILKFSQNFLFYKAVVFLTLICSSLSATEPSDEVLRSRILYLLKTQKENTALDLYQDYYKQKGRHDTDLLEQIALILIEQGFNSDTPELQVLSIYGAGISNNEQMLDILKAGMLSKQPEVQLICLNFLSRFHHDDANLSLKRAMNSNHLLIRLEAGFHLCEQKAPAITSQIESLMNKVDEALHPLFPQFFALIGTREATKTLSRLLNSRHEKVRAQAIISAGNYGRDDLIPIIRKLAAQSSILQQEAAAHAFYKMKDEGSILRLEELAGSHNEFVRLASLKALYHLGQKNRLSEIENFAKELNPYAIYMLSEMPGSEALLISLKDHEQLNVRINANIALLKLKNPKSIDGLLEILIRDNRDLGLIENRSLAGTLKYIKATPSASHNFKGDEMYRELSLKMREQILIECSFLAEKDFLNVAKILFDTHQNELVPQLVFLIESIQTKEAVEVLKLYSQKAGAPLIRNYCNLALFRLKEEGPYKDNLEKFILQEYKTDLIQFRPFLSFEMRTREAQYQLTPRDTSRLLVDAFEALTLRQDEQGINILLQAIQHGNPKNKYALAGLLMHAAR